MEVIYKNETLDKNLEMYSILKEGIANEGTEIFVYDVTEWRLLFPEIPNDWYVEDLEKGKGYMYYFQDEMFIATTVNHPEITLYMHIKYKEKRT